MATGVPVGVRRLMDAAGERATVSARLIGGWAVTIEWPDGSRLEATLRPTGAWVWGQWWWPRDLGGGSVPLSRVALAVKWAAGAAARCRVDPDDVTASLVEVLVATLGPDGIGPAWVDRDGERLVTPVVAACPGGLRRHIEDSHRDLVPPAGTPLSMVVRAHDLAHERGAGGARWHRHVTAKEWHAL